MSVPKNKRGESSVQFLDTAHQLHIYTVKQCTSLPKRYTFYGAQKLAELSFDILTDVKMANSIYPKNAHEYQCRLDRFLSAYGKAQAMVSQVGAMKEMFSIPTKSVMGWMELIQSELRLLKGIMLSDSHKWSDFDEKIHAKDSREGMGILE